MKKYVFILGIVVIVFISGCVQDNTPAPVNGNQPQGYQPRQLTQEEKNFVSASVDIICAAFEGTYDGSTQSSILSKYGMTMNQYLQLSDEYSNDPVIENAVDAEKNTKCPGGGFQPPNNTREITTYEMKLLFVHPVLLIREGKVVEETKRS